MAGFRTLWAYALYNWETKELSMGRLADASGMEIPEGSHLYRIHVELPEPDDCKTIELKTDDALEEWETQNPMAEGQSFENYVIRHLGVLVGRCLPSSSYGGEMGAVITMLPTHYYPDSVTPPQNEVWFELPEGKWKIALTSRGGKEVVRDDSTGHLWEDGPDGPLYHCSVCGISKCDDHDGHTCAQWKARLADEDDKPWSQEKVHWETSVRTIRDAIDMIEDFHARGAHGATSQQARNIMGRCIEIIEMCAVLQEREDG